MRYYHELNIRPQSPYPKLLMRADAKIAGSKRTYMGEDPVYREKDERDS